MGCERCKRGVRVINEDIRGVVEFVDFGFG